MAQTRRGWILISLVTFGLTATLVQAAQPAKKPAKPVQAAKPAPTRKATVVAGAKLVLPADSKVKVRWVCPPLDAKEVKEAYWYDTRFVVDNAGRPWFGIGRDDIVSPTQQYRFTFDHMYNDIACLSDGTFLVANSSDLGFVMPPEAPKTDYDGIPLAHFQPIAGLPVPECRLFAGVGNCVYLTGWNPTTEVYEVYMLRPEKLTIGGTGVREYVKVFSSKEMIAAVAGDGQRTYLAMNKVIVKVVGSDCSKVHVEPSTFLRGLAYSPEAGLFYTTWDGVGYIGANGTLQLMSAPQPQICLQKGSLYVLFPKTMGVLALDNVQDLKRCNLAFKEVPATQSDEVKVKSIRFFEAGETAPDPGNRHFATTFAKASTRYVYCQVDMDNLLKGKRRHAHVIRMELTAFDEMWCGLEEIRLDIGPELKDVWGWARFGSADPGTFYPGTYTLKTYLDGSKIDERRFTIQGEPTLLEAAMFNDTAKLWKLLESGGDVNAVDAHGRTPLILAVSNGSLENVRLLLNHKASINLKDSEGNTALLMACSRYGINPAITRVLVEAGAEVNVADKNGKTPLHNAAANDDMETLRLLLDHGANPNARDKDQSTPLMETELIFGDYAFGVKPEVVELLLSRGADANAADKDGRTPFWDALMGKDPEMIRLFIKHGANVNATRKYDGGSAYSVLGNTVVSYSTESDRLGKSRLREIVGILCDSGAKLLTEEINYVVTTGTINLLGRKQIADILDRSESAVMKYQPEDPWLQRYVLKRLTQMAYLKVSWAKSRDDFAASINLCQEAVSRAEKWNLQSLIPEIYYSMGMLAAKTGGDSSLARRSLQKYLELAPNGWKANSAKQLLNNL